MASAVGISKKGEPYLRRLLVLGATAVVRYARNKPELAGWVNALLAWRPARVVTVAVANKLARIVWAIMQRGGIIPSKDRSALRRERWLGNEVKRRPLRYRYQTQRSHEIGRSDDDVMASGRQTEDQDVLYLCIRTSESVKDDWDPISGQPLRPAAR